MLPYDDEQRMLDELCRGDVDAIGVTTGPPRLPWVIYRSAGGWIVDADLLDAPLEGALPSLEFQINRLQAAGKLPLCFANALANAVWEKCK
jgi:hypothetical protein